MATIYNLLVNFGIAYTYPLFISVGAILGIPSNAIVDAVRCRILMYFILTNNAYRLLGGLLSVLLKFLVMYSL